MTYFKEYFELLIEYSEVLFLYEVLRHKIEQNKVLTTGAAANRDSKSFLCATGRGSKIYMK